MSTQAALYDEIDLELSWSEAELPERERTKHVHRLHPYLGKFVPQLAEVFLRRYATAGDLVWDPFAGSGTTLVEANAYGARAAGCDVSAFNCLLMEAKLGRYEPSALLSDVVRLAQWKPAEPADLPPYLSRWFAPGALADLHGDARKLEPPGEVGLVLTSPPYPGLIDYHEQHAYAFELLGLDRRDSDEVGRGAAGYSDAVAQVLARGRTALKPGGRVVVVVNDRRGLYDGILEAAGLRLEERLLR